MNHVNTKPEGFVLILKIWHFGCFGRVNKRLSNLVKVSVFTEVTNITIWQSFVYPAETAYFQAFDAPSGYTHPQLRIKCYVLTRFAFAVHFIRVKYGKSVIFPCNIFLCHKIHIVPTAVENNQLIQTGKGKFIKNSILF